MNPFFVRISVERKRDCAMDRARNRPWRVTAIAAGTVGLIATILALPASAATTGSNSSTVGLLPPPVRSITVSPTTGAFGECSGPNSSGSSPVPSEIAFPNGSCQIGDLLGGGGVTGGITITNGTEAGHIDVSGQSATPADAGTPWTLEAGSLPGVDQFDEATIGGQIQTVATNSSSVQTVPLCDQGFTVFGLAGSCTASANQSSNELLGITGPSSSTDQNGPFSITTTWTAVP
jgi:hypothetical protein